MIKPAADLTRLLWQEQQFSLTDDAIDRAAFLNDGHASLPAAASNSEEARLAEPAIAFVTADGAADTSISMPASPAADQPDLTASNVTVSDATPNANQLILVNFQINNVGSSSSPSSFSGIYLSSNPQFDPVHALLLRLVGTDAFSGPGSFQYSAEVSLSGKVSAGQTYYVFVAADGGNAVNEAREDNNVSAGAAFTVNAVPVPFFHGFAGDFDGDGKSDFLWQDDAGQVAIWLMNGTTPVRYAAVGPAPGYQVIGAGDFNGDGKDDILFQAVDHRIAIWLMEGVTPVAQSNAGPNPGLHQALGTGDFNGDGKDDIVLQHDDGRIAVWLMDGITPIAAGYVGANPGVHHLVATGDFNGDRKADLLFQHDDGRVALWLMDGLTPIAQGYADSNPGTVNHVVGAADYNGDGKADIAFQHDDGRVALWLMDGFTPIAQANVNGNPGPSNNVVGQGDFNGDHLADVSFQSDSGQAAIWLMNGLTPLAQANAGPDPGTAWHLI